MRCLTSESVMRALLARNARSSDLAAVDLIGALLEGRGETPESCVEHRAHQHAKHAALELIVDEELDVAGRLARRFERPVVLHAAERALQIFDQDLQLGSVERDTATEGLAHQLER